jgi:hypothetical protein
MADEIIIETTSSQTLEVGTPGPQGPKGDTGDVGPAGPTIADENAPATNNILWQIRTSAFTAVSGGRYVANGTFTVTNPASGNNGELFQVVVASGTVTVNGVAYAASRWPVTVARVAGAWTTLANTLTENLTLNGTNSTAPNQTAASGGSLMTRDLGDARYNAWDKTHEISNFTGATAGTVSGGSTSFLSGFAQLRAAAGGSYRSFWSYYTGQTTGVIGDIAAGGWRSETVLNLEADSRCQAAFYPLGGNIPVNWSGRANGTFGTGGVVIPYFLFRDGSWRAVKATSLRGSSTLPVRASNVVTVTTNGAHNLVAGDFVAIGGVAPQSFQTIRSEVLATPTTTTFTYANTGTDETATANTGDNMLVWKVEDLGEIAVSSTSNLFSATRTWRLTIAVSDSGTATYIANGTTVATGSGFSTSSRNNACRVAYYVETLAAATSQTDLYVQKFRHTVNP